MATQADNFIRVGLLRRLLSLVEGGVIRVEQLREPDDKLFDQLIKEIELEGKEYVESVIAGQERSSVLIDKLLMSLKFFLYRPAVFNTKVIERLREIHGSEHIDAVMKEVREGMT